MTPCAFVCLRESAMTASTAGLLVPACPRSLSSLHVRTRHMLTCRELCAALSSAGCDCARVLGRLTCRFELSRHAATSRVVNRYLPKDTCRSNHLCRIATSLPRKACHPSSRHLGILSRSPAFCPRLHFVDVLLRRSQLQAPPFDCSFVYRNDPFDPRPEYVPCAQGGSALERSPAGGAIDPLPHCVSIIDLHCTQDLPAVCTPIMP